jgi:hypothetical protein
VIDSATVRRLRAEAARQGKSLSRLARDILTERVGTPVTRRGRRTSLLRLCGLAHGELTIPDLDRELYAR